MRRLEVLDNQRNDNAIRRKEEFHSIFEENEECRWSFWKHKQADEMLTHVTTEVFPFIQSLDGKDETVYSKYMKGATFMIQKASLLEQAVSILDKIDITSRNQDAQGDIFEYLLSELQISGDNGQFRTPRHIIRMIIELVNPQIGETVCDPACGTGGFLINAYEHVVKNNTSKELIVYDVDRSAHNLIGDKITKKSHWDLLKNKTFYGFEFDFTMLRIGVMNMVLHGIQNPNISYSDSISKRFDQTKQYDIILANPPFSGSIDEGDIHDDLQMDTTMTEALFLKLFYNIVKIGGRIGVIVPSGILSGRTNAQKKIRKLLLEKCQLEAVIYMPSGIFEPYAGVDTAVLIITKGGHTDKVWFYEMEKDGYSLDKKRNFLDGQGDIPDIIKNYKGKKESEKSFNVETNKIKDNGYKLIPTIYTEIKYEKVDHVNPKTLLGKIKKIEDDISKDLTKLKDLI